MTGLTSGIKRPYLVDLTESGEACRDARMLYADPKNGEILSAMAKVTRSSIGRIVGNFVLSRNKEILPTRLFDSEEEAIKWLKR